MAKIILGTWMNSLRLDPLKILVEGVLRERYSLQEGVFNDYVFSFPIYLMLEFYSTIIPPVILQSPWNYFSITMGKREVALDDFLISIQISLGIMPYTFNKTIPTSTNSTPSRKLYTTTSKLKNSKPHHENPIATAYL